MANTSRVHATSTLRSISDAADERVAPAVRDERPLPLSQSDFLALNVKHVHSPVLQMQDDDDASRNAKRVWDEERGQSRPKNAEGGTKVLDCHVHLERNCKRVGDCPKHIWEQKFQPDINRVKRMPTSFCHWSAGLLRFLAPCTMLFAQRRQSIT